jgi:RES domain-containing protein
MLRAFRVLKARHARAAMTGEGARRFGGRWNRIGEPVVYMSQSLALAVLETIAHLPRGEKLPPFRMIQAEFEEKLVETVEVRQLPKRWKDKAHQEALQALGSKWLSELRSSILRVPSIIIPEEYNYLINPLHPSFVTIKVSEASPFWLDPRLVK